MDKLEFFSLEWRRLNGKLTAVYRIERLDTKGPFSIRVGSLAQYFEEALRQGFVVRYFMINQNQRYKVDLNARYQQNITSGTKRTIRKRPLFQSIVTLLPYLKTLSGSFETCPSVPESPSPAATNSDCEHMYPETWIPMDPNVDFIKVPMSLDDKAYRVVYNLFHKTMLETKFVILSILRVQNQFLWDKYI
eukprot:g34710.t1